MYANVIAQLRDGLDPDWQYGKSTNEKLDGHDLPTLNWLTRFYPHVASSPLAPRMVALWEWLDNLEAGTKSRPRVEIWPRGGAKSSTVELGVCRCCAKLSRRFVLYVSDIQDQADNHVQNISDFLQTLGAQPAMHEVNKGKAKAWRHNQLRTANGFNVASFGIDAGQRGIRIEQYRPDLIIFDDVDSRHDSPLVVQKKIECLTQSILPAGSGDCAVLFVENKVHANSIASKLSNGTADFLLDRDLATIEPAVRDLETVLEEQPDGKRPLYRIVAGEPTWAGQDLVKCEAQINEWGLTAFLREAQHEVTAGTAFFDGFDIDRHVIEPPYEVDGEKPPKWWYFYGGLDWGYSDAFAFILWGRDDTGCHHAIASVESTRLTLSQQVAKVEAILGAWGIPRGKCEIRYDRSMSYKGNVDGFITEPKIKPFQDAGLLCVAVGNTPDEQSAGFEAMRDLMIWPGKPSPVLRIWDRYNTDLIFSLQNATHDRLQAEKLNHDECSHLAQAARYALSTWASIGKKPKETRKPTPEELQQQADEKAREFNEALAAHLLKERNESAGIIDSDEQMDELT